MRVDMDHIDYRLYVVSDELREHLAPTRRVAWAALCAESVLRLYSAYFWERFPVAEAFDRIWSYVFTENAEKLEGAKLHRRLGALQRTARREHYYIEFDILRHLLQETWEGAGAGAAGSASAAHRAFSAIVHFRNGLDDRDPALPQADIYRLMERHLR